MGLRALQTLVVVMGVMILAGLGLIVFSIAHHTKHVQEIAEGPAVQRSIASDSAARLVLPAPAGSHIVGMTASSGRFLIETAAPDGGQSLWLLDAVSGKLVETVAIGTDTGSAR